MGFSLRDKFNEATAQLNVFDGGKSAVTVRNNRQAQAVQTLKKKQDDEATMNMLRQKANQRLEQQARTGTIPVSRVPGFGVRKPEINQAIAYNQNKFNLMYDGDKTQMPKVLPDVDLNQGVMSGFRNVLDSNSPVDQVNRAREGRAVSYRQSELDRGNMRPMENIGQQLVGNTARLINTVGQSGQTIPLNVRIQTAQATGNMQALEQALKESESYNTNLSSGRGGVLNAGNFLYNNEEDLNMSTGEALKRSGLNTIGTASEILPFKINPMKTASLTTRLVANAGVDAGLGAGESSARQYLQTGKIDPKTVAVDSVANTLMGTAPTLGGAGVNKFRDPVVQTKLVNNAGKANLTRTIAKQDPQIIQIERRIDGGVAMLPTLRGAEKASKKQEVLELIRLRNQRTKDLSGTGAVGKDVRPTAIKPELDDARIHSMQDQPMHPDDLKEAMKSPAEKKFEVKAVKDQEKIVKDYAKELRSIEVSSKGGQMIQTPDGYKRVSEHSPFYRDFYNVNGRKPTVKDYQEFARNEIERGQAPTEISKAFKDSADPEIASLIADESRATGRKIVLKQEHADIKQRGGQEKAIAVTQLSREGDVVTAKQVNPDVRAKEKRYSIDDDGKMIEDKKGAYSLFTDDEGKVKGFRVGKKYIDAKELGDLSDVNGYSSTMATMGRNIERSFGKETGDKVNRFIVDYQQEQATKLVEKQVQIRQGLKEVSDELGLNFKGLGRKKAKQVSADIQNFGENRMNKSLLVEKYGKEYAEKIAKADKWFRNQYDTLLDDMNRTLVEYGYEPVPKRKNYYTHFQEPKLWEKFGLKMQEIKSLTSPTMQDAMPDKARGSISNKIAGESEYLQPNKRFNPFALQRKGDVRTADAFEAFERYMSPTLSNIYMTPAITRARVLSKAIAQDADLAGKDANGVLTQLKEWSNSLAGKSNRWGDRQLSDTRWGRNVLGVTNFAQKKAGQNTILGNLATATLQPIVLAQTTGKFGYKNTLLGMLQEMNPRKGIDPKNNSRFLKRRYSDTSSVSKSGTDVYRETINKPLEVIEQASTEITWRSAYNDALSQGKNGNEAIRYADVETEKTVAGRSLGEKPELYRSKALGPATMYQLEVNNYWQQLTKEMTTKQKLKTFATAYTMGVMLQEVIGRDVGFNPVDAVIDSYKELGKDEKSNKDKAISIAQRLGGEVVDNVPVLPSVASFVFGNDTVKKVLGPDSNIGRFGTSSPLSSLDVVRDPWNAVNLVAPGGAGQIKKSVKGVKTLIDGKMTDKEGDTTVDVEQSNANIARGTLFGPSAIKEVNQYYDNLGKKKVDQKPVGNQKDSVAGTQSNEGLTREQQRANPDEATRKEFVDINKVDRQVDREKEEIKVKESETVKQLSNGKVYAKVDDEWKTFDSQADYDKNVEKQEKQKKIDDFVSSGEKTKEIEGVMYLKSDDNEQGYTTKSKVEHQFDKDIQGVAIAMDKAKASKDYKTWLTNADKKYEALVKKRDSYDPDTEFDKIDTVNKQLLDLQQEYDKYDGYGGQFTKGKKGSKTRASGLDLSKMFGYGNPATSVNKSLRSLLETLV